MHEPHQDSPSRDNPKCDNPKSDYSKRGIPNEGDYWALAVRGVYDGTATDYALRFGAELAAADHQIPISSRLVLSRYTPDELADRLRAASLTPELVRTRPPRPGGYPADKIRITARR